MDKLREFADLLEKQQIARLYLDGLACEPNINNARVKIIPGRKYTRVNVGTSGKYMVVNETGEIYGIKAYGVIHRGHRYGTLDTVNNWYWGRYSATPIKEV
jgi:hypothetical protein